MTEAPRPHDNTYWVVPGRVLAGEYPGDRDPDVARARLEAYLETGITHFIDLTEDVDGLLPYDGLLAEIAAERGLMVEYRRHPIRDMSVPRSPQEVVSILEAIEGALRAGGRAYVHCWGGIGRTGTVVGCYLVRRGMTGEEALEALAALWPQMEKSRWYRQTPQTLEQVQFVRAWRHGAGAEDDSGRAVEETGSDGSR